VRQIGSKVAVAVLPARVVVLTISLLAVPFTFLLATRLWGRVTGLAAAALLVASPAHMDVTRVARVDGPMTTFCVMAMYAAVRYREGATRRRLLTTGLLVGAAASCKYCGGLVAIPILCLVAATGSRRTVRAGPSALLCAIALAGFVLTSPHIVLAFPEFLATYRWVAPFYSRGRGRRGDRSRLVTAASTRELRPRRNHWNRRSPRVPGRGAAEDAASML
jgi:4-amino-4-deoxy-L-arabinose transferase-like glycosyltransferase